MTADIVIFSGPTLSAEDVRAAIDAECRPPAAQGDVYLASLSLPRGIGIVDGYFHGVPSIWHKEILWAIDRGIAVYGSASMGALRAAELSQFGMRGVGRIFEQYDQGYLEDDDEVAVTHAPAELGFSPLSEPMVNVRATVAKAVEDGIVSQETAGILCAAAKSIYYADRTWDSLLEHPSAVELPPDELNGFEAWLGTGRVDLKKQDALAMLDAMRADLERDASPEPVCFDFEWTDMWETFSAQWSSGAVNPRERIRAEADQVLDELRLTHRQFGVTRERALLRLLAVREAERRKLDVGREDLKEQLSNHRAEHGLFRRPDLDRWLENNGMDALSYENLLAEEHLVGTVTSLSGDALHHHMLAELKRTGRYADLAQRAHDKAGVLAHAANEYPGPEDTGLRPIDLLRWFFEDVCGQAVPDDVDAFAHRIELASRAEIYRLLAREYLYLTGRSEDGAGV